MIVGGLVGGVAVPLLGLVGGPAGAYIVGAVGGLMAGILISAEVCSLGWLYGSPANGDYSWLNPLTVGFLAVGPIVGAYFGALAEDLNLDLLLYAGLGGMVLAGWLGARLGEHLARKSFEASRPMV
jgi:hypothetical protein